MRTIVARAPAKAILLGEHAVNRGAMALAVSVGLYARCTVSTMSSATGGYTLRGAGCQETVTREQITGLGATVDGWRASEQYGAIQSLAATDFFSPTKYVLAALRDALPRSMDVTFDTEIPASSGLGSGGATFVAVATAAARLLDLNADPRQIAAWAKRGDMVAHGGIASGLDTQTSLYGGVIRYTADVEGQAITYCPGLCLVIGNTGVVAATSEVNSRVRQWLAERPTRIHYLREIGLLARHAEAALRDGVWVELGHLMNLNQLILERMGVSCPELERLIDAALGAGALGAKLSGSGGGGIMIALVTPDIVERVAAAIAGAGGTPVVVPVGVAGVEVERSAPACPSRASSI